MEKKMPEVRRCCHSVGTPGLVRLERRCLLDKLSVDVEILERYVMGAADIVTAAVDVVEAAVFHADVADMAVVVQANDEYAQFAFLAGDVFQVDVAHDGVVAALAAFAVFVLQVDAQHGFAALADGDVAHEDVFNQSAAAGAGLDADDTV